MSLTAGRAIKAVLNNKDIHVLLAEDEEIFGPYVDAYRFIKQYHQDHGSLPTPSIVTTKLKDPTLFEGMDDVDGSSKHYVSELREEFIRSEIQDMIIALGQNLNKRTTEEILNKAGAKISELISKGQKIVDVNIMDPELARKDFQQAREDDLAGTFGILTGIPEWDEYSPGGALPGQSIVLFGYSGKTKSWAADIIAASAYRQGRKVLFVSLEMTEKQQRSRVWAITADGNFAMSDLQKGYVSDDQIEEFSEKHLNTGGEIIVVAPNGSTGMTPNQIRAKVEQHKPDIVIVDYLQLMDDNFRTKEMTPRMLNVSRDMKQLAMSANIPVVSISAVTDDEGKKRDKPPMISQLAWSRAIEFDSDVAIAIHKYDNTDIVEMVARKHRNGELFAMRYEVDLGRGVFRPIEDDDEED